MHYLLNSQVEKKMLKTTAESNLFLWEGRGLGREAKTRKANSYVSKWTISKETLIILNKLKGYSTNLAVDFKYFNFSFYL